MPEPNPIDRAFFRPSEDGATVFFPWGLTRRGYRITDEETKQRADRAASFLVMLPIAVGTWAGHALVRIVESETADFEEIVSALAAPGIVFLLGLLFYALWIWRFVEDLAESDLKISREERIREAARLVEPWKVAVVGMVLAILSAAVAWLEPRMVWLGVLGIAMGIGLVFWSSVLKRARTGLQ